MSHKKEDGIWFPQSIHTRVPRLSLIQKFIYAKIESAYKQFGEATFKDRYFARLLNISSRQARKHIKQIESLGYIKKWIKNDNGYNTRYMQPVTSDRVVLPKTTSKNTQSIRSKSSVSIYKSNTNKEYKESKALTIPSDLIEEMQKQYPKLNIDLLNLKFTTYYHNKSITSDMLPIRYKEWCKTERIPSNTSSNSSQFNIDALKKKISDVGSYRHPSFKDGEEWMQNVIRRNGGWARVCKMDNFQLNNAVKNCKRESND